MSSVIKNANVVDKNIKFDVFFSLCVLKRHCDEITIEKECFRENCCRISYVLHRIFLKSFKNILQVYIADFNLMDSCEILIKSTPPFADPLFFFLVCVHKEPSINDEE